MKRKGKLAEPHSNKRKEHLQARHAKKAKRAADSTITGKRFEHTRQSRKRTKADQKKTRSKRT